jgi:hypothetical protein
MKKAWIVACAVLLISVTGFAQTPAPLPSDVLTAILSQPDGSCDPQQSQVLFAAARPGTGQEKSLCTVTANCGAAGTVSCQGNSSCTAQDRNCSNHQEGRVTCDGVATVCPAPTCTDYWCGRCSAHGLCIACCECNGGFDCVNQCKG